MRWGPLRVSTRPRSPLQVLALFAMEPPVSLGAEDVRNEKVKVLRSISPIRLEDVVLGQYKGVPREGLPGSGSARRV